MATRGVYRFRDRDGKTFRVYKHWDNYPECAVIFIMKAMSLAWEAPRFEADEFACAFIAANKKSDGDLRLMEVDCDAGQEYEYDVSMSDEGKIHVSVFEIGKVKAIWKGTIDKMAVKFGRKEAA